MYYPPYNKTEQTKSNKNSNTLVDVTPFSPIVLKSKYIWDNKSEVIKWCENLVNSEKPKQDTSWINGISKNSSVPHMNPIFKNFYNWLDGIAMDIIVNQYGYDKNMLYTIQNSWINLHSPGGSTEIHHHGPAIISVATYLHMPENGGYIEFKDPLEYNKGYFPVAGEDDISNWKVVPTLTNDVVLFPGWLRHRTQKNKSKENRWVLTTNYICKNILK